MKVLWITPNVPSRVLSYYGRVPVGSGGWIDETLKLLLQSPSVELTVLYLSKSHFKSLQFGRLRLIPIFSKQPLTDTSKSLAKLIRTEVLKFSPDVIDFQGIEFGYSLYADYISSGIASIATIQGCCSVIADSYFGGINKNSFLSCTTLKDLLLLNTVFQRQSRIAKRARSEHVAIKAISSFIGRTEWDFQFINALHGPCFQYYNFSRPVRTEILAYNWSPATHNPLQIYFSQAHVPYKGLHILIEALSMVKHYFPSVQLLIGGRFRHGFNVLKANILLGSYELYISRLIIRYSLVRNVQFLGPLKASQVGQYLSSSRLYVQSSFVENSPNSLLEAQAIGTPCIASNVGGTNSVIAPGGALLYNPCDVHSLTDHIISLLSNLELCNEMSVNSSRFIRARQAQLDLKAGLMAAYENTVFRHCQF